MHWPALICSLAVGLVGGYVAGKQLFADYRPQLAWPVQFRAGHVWVALAVYPRLQQRSDAIFISPDSMFLRAVARVQPASGMAPEYYADLAPGRLDVLNVGDDPAPAEQRLRDGDIDLLIIAPESASTELRAGRQTTIRVAWNEIDPVYHQLAGLATSILTSSLNAEIIEQAAEEGISFAEAEVGEEVTGVPPEVIARPTNAETTNVAPAPGGLSTAMEPPFNSRLPDPFWPMFTFPNAASAPDISSVPANPGMKISNG